jgi:GR25 family glycosyltransferase involved in LPS biosynthesis
MKIFSIECPELPDRIRENREHLKRREVPAQFIAGIHGETFGLLPSRPYNADRPGQGHLTPISQVGLTLSHYMVWSICNQFPDEEFLILEDDAKLPMDWEERLHLVMSDLPADWDIFLIGNSNTKDKEQRHVCGDVWEVKYPFCTHAYLVRWRALETLLAVCRDATTKIDLLLIREAYPRLRVYTCLPRIVDQRGTELAV